MLLTTSFVYEDNKSKSVNIEEDKGIQTPYYSSTDIPGRQYDLNLHPVRNTPVSGVTRKLWRTDKTTEVTGGGGDVYSVM